MIAMTTTRNILLAASILIVVAACARREESPLEGDLPVATAEGNATVAQPAAPAAANDFVQGPKVVAPIQVEVVLTPAARAELTAKSESIVVEALYGGDPAPAAASQVNEFGLVQLGKTQQTLPPAGGTAGFSEDEINRQRLDLIVGQPQVMFNVRSARKAVPKNLLACELYWDSVQTASAAPIQIPCRLLSEPAPARAPAQVAPAPAAAAAPASGQTTASSTPTPASLDEEAARRRRSMAQADELARARQQQQQQQGSQGVGLSGSQQPNPSGSATGGRRNSSQPLDSTRR